MPDHLFVYGTLRTGSGHPMANRLRVGAKHVGKGSTPGMLYDFGSYPGAVFVSEEKCRVIGDVFVLNAPRLLEDLDKYEGVGQGGNAWEHFYERVAIEVALDRGGALEAWAYQIVNPPRARLIGSGDFIADRRSRSQRPTRP
jgi:gamma-glutamylcyclotransferase (GGCT)/AIG2-like uncharacterized protein YtfP